MARNNIDLLGQAINYCHLLLKFRQRSEFELYGRLKKKNFDDSMARQAVDFLKERDFVNDDKFASAWIKSRLKKPFGLRRIRQELKLKGVSLKTVEDNISKISSGYSEKKVVSEIIRQRLDKLKSVGPEVAKKRAYGYLLRRGFALEIINEVLKINNPSLRGAESDEAI